METKERKNTNTRPRTYNTGKCVDCLEIKFGGKKSDTQFTRIGKKKNILFVKDTN